jgi:hypothetical protein
VRARHLTSTLQFYVFTSLLSIDDIASTFLLLIIRSCGQLCIVHESLRRHCPSSFVEPSPILLTILPLFTRVPFHEPGSQYTHIRILNHFAIDATDGCKTEDTYNTTLTGVTSFTSTFWIHEYTDYMWLGSPIRGEASWAYRGGFRIGCFCVLVLMGWEPMG